MIHHLNVKQLALVVASLLFAGCGGKAYSDQAGTDASATDASHQDASTDTNPLDASMDTELPDSSHKDAHLPDAVGHDASSDVSVDVGVDVGADAKPDADAGLQCVCKFWTDDFYPAIFFKDNLDMRSCVVHPCPDGKVCCATPCVDPSVCRYYSGKLKGDDGCRGYKDQDWEPKDDCCWTFSYTACVPPEQCAPDGVLHPATYDPDVNKPVLPCSPEYGH